MNQMLLEQLRRITPEEEKLLDGAQQVDRTLYTETKEFTIDSEKMLQKGKLIDVRPHTRFVRFPEHRHNYVEIILVCEGHLTHIINRTNRVEMQAGDFLFLNQYATHEILPAGEQDLAVNFIVLPEFFDTAQEMLGTGNVIYQFLTSSLRRNGGEGQYLHFRAEKLLPALNLAENMIWSLLNRQPDQRHTNQITMGLLLLHLLNHIETLAPDSGALSRNRIVMEALSYIQTNYAHATLTELSEHLKLPVYTLSKVIKTETGSTFQELLQKKRLHQAARLMKETALTITDIISAVGYDNSSFFYRVFREEFGTTPKEYREKRDGKENLP